MSRIVFVWLSGSFSLPWKSNNNTGYLAKRRSVLARNSSVKHSADGGAM
jgi:hypothetical protein